MSRRKLPRFSLSTRCCGFSLGCQLCTVCQQVPLPTKPSCQPTVDILTSIRTHWMCVVFCALILLFSVLKARPWRSIDCTLCLPRANRSVLFQTPFVHAHDSLLTHLLKKRRCDHLCDVSHANVFSHPPLSLLRSAIGVPCGNHV